MWINWQLLLLDRPKCIILGVKRMQLQCQLCMRMCIANVINIVHLPQLPANARMCGHSFFLPGNRHMIFVAPEPCGAVPVAADCKGTVVDCELHMAKSKPGIAYCMWHLPIRNCQVLCMFVWIAVSVCGLVVHDDVPVEANSHVTHMQMLQYSIS